MKRWFAGWGRTSLFLLSYALSTKSQLKVDVSRTFELFTTKPVPAVVTTVRVPTLVKVPEVVSCKNTLVLAVTDVFATVRVPDAKVPVPTRALEPLLMESPLPAVVAKMLPVAAASPVNVLTPD